MAHARPASGINDLATVRPDLAAQWHPILNGDLTPADVRFSSNRPVWWLCPDHPDHEWRSSPNSRSRGTRVTASHSGCPYCGNRVLLPGFNDLATVHPDLAAQWHPVLNGDLTPHDVFANRNASVWWVCSDHPDHVFRASPANRARQHSGCTVCSGRTVLAGVNDLATVRPDIAAQWHPTRNGDLAPTDVVRTSHRTVWWACPDHPDHAWRMSVAEHTTRDQGCPICSGRQVLAGFNDMATIRPDRARLWHPTRNGDLTPADVTAGTDLRLWWRCPDCGREWQAHGYAVGPCPGCQQFSSLPEGELADVVVALLPGETVLRNVRSILPDGRMELDIWLPGRRVAIEFNGVYWHSEPMGHDAAAHRAKLTACNAAGIRLITVWSDDFQDRRDVVIRSLAHKLGVVHRLPEVLGDGAPAHVADRVFARCLVPAPITVAAANRFFAANHIQGSTSLTRAFALFDDDGAPRAVLGLRAPRAGARTRRGPGEWEIVRYATLGLVPGGFTRLVAHAERVLRSEGIALRRWISFAAAEMSDGGLYERAGFTADRRLPPDYWYAGSSTDWHRMAKEGYQRSRFRDDPSLAHVDGATERELAELNHLVRVWDLGKTRYVKDVAC